MSVAFTSPIPAITRATIVVGAALFLIACTNNTHVASLITTLTYTWIRTALTNTRITHLRTITVLAVVTLRVVRAETAALTT